MKYSNVKMSAEDRKYLKNKYGTIQNAFKQMLEKEKDHDKKVKEFQARLEGKEWEDV